MSGWLHAHCRSERLLQSSDQ